MGGFIFLDHKADAYIMAYGDNLNESFEYAAKAMFEVITDTSKVNPIISKRLHITSFDLYSLLYSWLEELLYIFDTEGIIFSNFHISNISKSDDGLYILDADASGEIFNPSKHPRKTIVKAITYYQMEIKEEGGKIVLKFVLDI